MKEKKDLNKDKNNIDDIKDKLTNSSNLIKEEGKNNINNNKINNIRDSDCSENMSNISIERKIPCFKTNFEEDINNNGKKRI